MKRDLGLSRVYIAGEGVISIREESANDTIRTTSPLPRITSFRMAVAPVSIGHKPNRSIQSFSGAITVLRHEVF